MLYFGILEGLVWAWLFWPVVGLVGVGALILIIRGCMSALTDYSERDYRDDHGNPFVPLILGVLLVAALVHFGGMFDLASFMLNHWILVLLACGGYGAIGILYMVLRGANRLMKVRKKRAEELAKIRSEFMQTRKRERGVRSTEQAAEIEREADEMIRAHKLSKPVQVAAYKGLLSGWAILWLPDMLYHTIFEFSQRLKDLWDIVWHFMRGYLQRAVNRYWGNLAEEVLTRKGEHSNGYSE